MTKPSVVVRSIALTGPSLPDAVAEFGSGLNVLYGASNTGKSFTLKAIDNMLGSESVLPNPKIRQGYDSVWLGLEFRDGQTKTIYRAASGGDFVLYEGLIHSNPETGGAKINVNELILGASGLLGKKVVSNADGQKQSLTIRTLAPYLLVSETAIIDERSPILTGQYQSATAEKNIFRLLLTGLDDSGVVAIEPKKSRKARNEAKIELVDELIARLEAKLGEQLTQRHLVTEQLNRLTSVIDQLSDRLRSAQSEIDRETAVRREAFERRNNESARFRELEITVGRFRWLLESYASDVARLEALEEAGSLLALRSERPCSLCGAAPEHHTSYSGGPSIEFTKAAASAELARLRRDRRDLETTIASLTAEAVGLHSSIESLGADVARLSSSIAELRPNEAVLRSEFQEKWKVRGELIDTLRRFEERDDLLARRQELEAASKRKATSSPKLTVGISGPTGHAFSKIVQEVLVAWQFPGTPEVTFEDSTQDIRVDGQDRKDNGKGVRAILHSAFKVALLIYCQRQNLPHPGFLVLDTPLLTYRDPLVSKHGELDADEQRLKSTGLNDAFYAHLHSLGASVQIIVLENEDPPPSIVALGNTQVFEGTGGNKRVGFFPVQSRRQSPSSKPLR